VSPLEGWIIELAELHRIYPGISGAAFSAALETVHAGYAAVNWRSKFESCVLVLGLSEKGHSQSRIMPMVSMA
jgi:hypothetical protein